VVTAGAPVSPRVLERCLGLLPQDAGVLCVYGATEALATALIDGREIVGETAALSARGAGICVGRPIEGTAVRIITVTDEPISEWSDRFLAVDGEVGEITVEGLGVTERYVGHQDINEAAKIRAGVGVLHRTGDLGYLDARGRLWFCGRKSHCVQTSKGRLFPEQVEGVFNPHPLVERTALVEVDGDPVLWIELKARARWADKRKLVQELRRLGETHAGAAAIRGFLFLPRFPTDVRHNSKILRERLAALAARRSISERW
jgi:acyl-CoA synthetase (AMP-forming)/AMP-acid ligase II